MVDGAVQRQPLTGSPTHPGAQVQVKLPTLSVQIALAPHGLLKHSLISEYVNH